jgi:hypothetical protein
VVELGAQAFGEVVEASPGQQIVELMDRKSLFAL